jgi:hypothetical protein
MREGKFNRASFVRYAYWTVLAALFICLKSTHPLDSDEGIVLDGAWSLLHGRELYTDVFWFVSPGSFYLVSWVWHVFWPDYQLAKILGTISILFTAVAIFRTSAIIAGKHTYVSFVAPVLYCMATFPWPTISYHTFNTTFLAWAMYFSTRALANGSLADIAAGGIFTGVAILFLQNTGMAFFFAVLLFFLFAYGGSRKLFYMQGAALYAAFSLAPLTVLLKWPIAMLYEDLISFPLHHYAEVAYLPLELLIIMSAYSALLFLLLRNRMTPATRLLFTVQLALLATVLSRADMPHTLIVMFPAFSLSTATALTLVETTHTVSGAIFTAALCAFAIPIFMARPLFYDITKDALMPYIKETCPTFYAGPFLPGLYFEARTLNPVSFPALLTNQNTDRQFKQAQEELASAPPFCAITNYAMVEKFSYDLQNPVDEFIRLHYAPVRAFGNMQVHILKLAALGDGRLRKP